MDGNLLDLLVLDDIIIVSLDNVHKAGSVTEVDSSTVCVLPCPLQKKESSYITSKLKHGYRL